MKKFSRYLDADGDGIAARSLPGVHRATARTSCAARGTTSTAPTPRTPTRIRRSSIGWRGSSRLAATAVPAPEIHTRTAGAEIGIVSLGGCHAAVLEAIDRLRDMGIVADYMRIGRFPFDAPVREFLDAHATIFVVEQNRDAQLRRCSRSRRACRATR